MAQWKYLNRKESSKKGNNGMRHETENKEQNGKH